MNMQTENEGRQMDPVNEKDQNRITEVTVFPSQAYLKRRLKACAKAGLNRFLVEIAALQVDGDSAQASVFGQGELLSTLFKEIPVKDFLSNEMQKLTTEIEQTEKKQEYLAKLLGINEKQIKFLDGVIQFAETEIPKRVQTQFPDTDNLATMVAFLGENYLKLAQRERELAQDLEDGAKHLSVLKRKMKQFGQSEASSQKVIEILFDAVKAHDIEIEVSYLAENASWEPIYKIDVPLDLSKSMLTMFAQIRQQTGEDWLKVKLSVSNALPLRGAALPDLDTWHLTLQSRPTPLAANGAVLAGSIPQPLPSYRRKGKTRGGSERSDHFEPDRAVAAALPEAELSQAAFKELPQAFEYQFGQGVTLKADGSETLLPLFTRNMKTDFFVYAVPAKDPLAYLACRAKADAELLAGRLNVYVEGRFVSGTAVDEKKAGEDLFLNLGVARNIKVRRKKVVDRHNETFFGMVDRQSIARELEYCTVIENLKEEGQRVHLLDSIPVSKTDRIQIKGVEMTPPPSKSNYRDRKGVMLWDFELGPKSVYEIRIKFFVKHPKNQPPQGL
jgi:uncharacterized protein (TIGR02231 family)